MRKTTEETPERFFVDTTVLRLGKWLRFLGVDTPQWTPKVPLTPKSPLLTKKRKGHETSEDRIWVPHDRIEAQLSWFVKRFPRAIKRERIGSRCLRCNHLLIHIPREDARDLVPDYVWQNHEAFTKCPACHRIYWRGTHRSRMLAFLKKIGGVPGEER